MDNSFEKKVILNLEQQKAVETANLYKELKKGLNEQVYMRLLEPNIVLTIGGLRIQTESFFQKDENNPKSIELYQQLEDMFAKKNIIFKLCFPNENKTQYEGLNVLNLNAYAEIPQLYTELIFSDDAKMAFQSVASSGTEEAKRKADEELESSLQKQFPNDGEFIEELETGIIKGYPYQAIVDFYEDCKIDMQHDLADSKDYLPDSLDRWKSIGAVPWFDFKIENKHNENIKRFIKRWTDFLGTFYSEIEK